MDSTESRQKLLTQLILNYFLQPPKLILAIKLLFYVNTNSHVLFFSPLYTSIDLRELRTSSSYFTRQGIVGDRLSFSQLHWAVSLSEMVLIVRGRLFTIFFIV